MTSSKQALWAAGRDEIVEVNQRALIDKVLARYSGEFTVFRELLQNSDDAGSRSVEIRFETKMYSSREKDVDFRSYKHEQGLPDLKTAAVHRWTFKNNGTVFRDQDWNRLKKIAEGNPDEEKIGAFGVGFYSLFSVTDEPWVTSGGQWMNFYWKDKKDQLYVRRGTVPAPVNGVVDPWTTFQMTLREPGPIPAALDFTRFLASSITFMTHLSEVSVYFDDKRLVRLSKNRGMSKEMPMLNGLKGTSPEGMMNVKAIETMPLHIEAEVVRWVYNVGSEKPSTTSRTDTLETATHQTNGFFSPQSDGFEASMPEVTPSMALEESTNLLETHSSNIVLTIFTANVDVRLDKKMTEELLRSTKKNPPSRLRCELIYTGKDAYDSSVKAEEEAAPAIGSVFQGLRADLEGTGSTRVFIGHSTGQTTGIGGHMATRFIPTVERESIDLVDRNVAVWNKELLYVGGFLARSAYELEMDAIKRLWEGATANGSGGRPDEDVQTRLRGRALHALKFFTFHPSTPSPVVSNVMQTAFFACATTLPFSIISSDGIRNATQAHSPNPEFSGFLKHLPLISEDVFNSAKTMIATLRARGMIKNVSFADILNGLRLGPLNETETVACLNWWIGVTKRGNSLNLQWRSQLLDALVISITGPHEKMMKLSDVQTFLNSKTGESIIPTDGPLPSTLLPMSITGSFDPEVLASVFPWKQLSLADWLRHLTDPKVVAANAEFDVTNSASWAERVLSVLAQAWPSLSETDQGDVIKVLNPKSCIPTSTGLKVPDQAYFPSVKLFRDLPIVTLPSGGTIEGNLEKVLQSLGVRKHVELQIIFERMIETGDWTTYDLVKYLVSIQSTLTPEEIERLCQSSAFLEGSAGEKRSVAGASQKVRVMDLYEPVDIYRKLGLPVIEWGADNQWRPESDEAKFVYSLGLKRAPPLSEILNIAASDDPTVRTKALTFFIDKCSDKYHDYDPENFRDLAFVPAILGSEKLLLGPFEVYAGSEWAALGFAVVDPALHDGAAGKLKLKNHPPTSQLVTLLEKSPPGDEAMARKWFEALSSRVPDFSQTELRKLSKAPFVPVTSAEDGSTKRLQPIQCYSGTGGSELHSKLFAFVDFGARANVFLGACGTKQEPSVEDIAQILVAEPRRFYKLANGRENYLLELRNLAVNWERLSTETILLMKKSNMVLGSRRVKKSGDKASSEGDEDDWDIQDELLQPKQVVIVDDSSAHQLFGDRIFCAPQDNMLEELYHYLGCPRLSSLIKEDYRTSGEVPYSKIGAQTRRLILERLPLFLRDHPQSRTKVTLNWLNEGNNFIVKVFGKLLVTKSLQYGNTRDSKSLEASAIAKREGNGPIELWLDGYQQVNMHEVSTSLCRIIFESPKANDALSFMTILSADLKVLKQWGYNVDKIVRQQKVEREAAERARAETETSLIPRPPQITMGDAQTRPRPMQARIPSPPNGTATTAAPLRNAGQEAANKARPETRASLVSNPPERTAQDNRARTSTTQTFILTSSIGITRAAPPQQNVEREAARAETRASPVSEPPQMSSRESYTGIPTRQPNIPSRQTSTAMAALQRQMAEREAAGQGRTETIGSPISNVPEMTGHNTQTTIPTGQPMIPPPPTGPTTAAPRPSATPRSTGRKRTSKRSRLSSVIHKLGRLLGRNRSGTSSRQAFPPESEDELSPSNPASPRRDDPPLPPLPNANLPEGAPWLSKPGLSRTSRRTRASGPTTASHSNLANNINKAINSCGHERSNQLRNREAMQVVEESLDDGYCDITGRIGDSDLDFVGQVGDIRIFAAPDLPEGGSLIQRKHDVLARFSQVLKYLAGVYKIPLKSLHIFADRERQLIAFNRNGSLFVNLGYFEEWHDRDVQRGDFSKALISWYFTLAHEIAHNLVLQHNSEHEFYFSAICEAYLVPLAKLLPDS